MIPGFAPAPLDYRVTIGDKTYRPVVAPTYETNGDGPGAYLFDLVPTRVTLPDGTTQMALSSWRTTSLDAAVAIGLLEEVSP